MNSNFDFQIFQTFQRLFDQLMKNDADDCPCKFIFWKKKLLKIKFNSSYSSIESTQFKKNTINLKKFKFIQFHFSKCKDIPDLSGKILVETYLLRNMYGEIPT